LPERKIQVTSVFRRLARELVIFMFIAGFVGVCIGIAYEFKQTKPPPPMVGAEPISKGAVLGSGPPCLAPRDQWQVVNPNDPTCQETPEQAAAREDRFEADEKARRQERLLDVLVFGVFGFGVGALVGVALWLFYRAGRFAITG
jgi:hypothetical protein